MLNALHPAEIAGVNARLYEATASGGCVNSEGSGHLGVQYCVGEEFLPSTSFDEFVDQARWCIDQSDEVRQIGDLATRRDHPELTLAYRLVELLEVAGLGQCTGVKTRTRLSSP